MNDKERENKELVRHFIEEAWNRRDLTALERYLHPRVVQHTPLAGVPLGPEAGERLIREMRQAFPDLRFVVEDLLAEGDRVMMRWHAEGTHRGEILGVPPSGRVVSMDGLSEHRIKSGRIAESWTEWDTLGMLRQMDANVQVSPHAVVGSAWARDTPKE